MVNGIDIQEYDAFGMIGDNLKLLQTIDLSKYDVIDLDAYGVPCDQLEIIFSRGYKGIIFFTFIQTMYGGLSLSLSLSLYLSIGIDAMIKKCPSVFNKKGLFLFFEYLNKHGVKCVAYIRHGKKVYGIFQA